VHKCGECGYETDRDRAASEVIRLRGLELSTQGLCGIENAYAVSLPGIDENQSRLEAKPRKGRTRNAQK
jgi:putative transposase